MKKSLVQANVRVAIIAIAASCSGLAGADTTGKLTEAIAQHSGSLVSGYFVVALSACANVYPDTRESVVGTMRSMIPSLKDRPGAENQWIESIGKCMSMKRSLNRSQCSEIAAYATREDISINDKGLISLFGEAESMISTCRN